jgi:hypothetical protein
VGDEVMAASSARIVSRGRFRWMLVVLVLIRGAVLVSSGLEGTDDDDDDEDEDDGYIF